jgi:hypothetical protein
MAFVVLAVIAAAVVGNQVHARADYGRLFAAGPLSSGEGLARGVVPVPDNAPADGPDITPAPSDGSDPLAPGMQGPADRSGELPLAAVVYDGVGIGVSPAGTPQPVTFSAPEPESVTDSVTGLRPGQPEPPRALARADDHGAPDRAAGTRRRNDGVNGPAGPRLQTRSDTGSRSVAGPSARPRRATPPRALHAGSPQRWIPVASVRATQRTDSHPTRKADRAGKGKVHRAGKSRAQRRAERGGRDASATGRAAARSPRRR